jgi:hypothetical protein
MIIEDNQPHLFVFDHYSVELGKSWITYKVFGVQTYCTPTNGWDISIDPPDQGGKIEITHTDRTGSIMKFIHYEPASLDQMFRFIARGYCLPPFMEGGVIEYNFNWITENTLRPCDCKDLVDVKKLDAAGIAVNEDSITVEPNHVILKFGNTTVNVSMSRFKMFSEWYLQKQKIDNPNK